MERSSMLRAGMTEQALAAKLGVTYHTVQAWERGHHAVRKGWDFKLAEALDCSVSDLRQADSVASSKR
jgi:DNA-binding XRE family transcriptional regulator